MNVRQLDAGILPGSGCLIYLITVMIVEVDILIN